MSIKYFASVVALCAATSVNAEGLYYGGGISITQAESDAGFGANTVSSDTYGAVTGTVGYRWDQSNMFYGAEFGLDVAVGSSMEDDGADCFTAANGPYYCDHVLTSRLRGIVGMPMGSFEGFASFGFASMSGNAATFINTQDVAVNSGYTFGLGLQQDLSGNTLRYELIYDNLETNTQSQGSGYEPTFEAISLNVSYLFN
ncbi:hypothetical protein [Yoonia maritima]|uniref:hypothetical protein n=1 Tax=Yoonia maritima TaxID=1435347 RepID=UPI000D0EF6B3|nr:hypothetical protein [Yoonia maritima]